MNVTESNHLVKLLRFLLDPDAGATREQAADAVEYLADRACTTLHTGVTGAQARAWLDIDAERRTADARWNEAIDWLINSRYMDPEALAAFWGMADGWVTREQAEAGFIGEQSIIDLSAKRED